MRLPRVEPGDGGLAARAAVAAVAVAPCLRRWRRPHRRPIELDELVVRPRRRSSPGARRAHRAARQRRRIGAWRRAPRNTPHTAGPTPRWRPPECRGRSSRRRRVAPPRPHRPARVCGRRSRPAGRRAGHGTQSAARTASPIPDRAVTRVSGRVVGLACSGGVDHHTVPCTCWRNATGRPARWQAGAARTTAPVVADARGQVERAVDAAGTRPRGCAATAARAP
jgi:hypothetical protein